MTREVPQYFGVAATTTREQVDDLVYQIEIIGLKDGVKLMNGPLVSYKTLTGQTPDNPNRYPPIEQVVELLSTHSQVLNIVHYNSRESNLADQLCQIVELSPLIHGIQLNIVWPKVDELVKFRELHPDILLVLQISRKSMEAVGELGLFDEIGRYEGLIDYVLLDLSGGTGAVLDSKTSDWFVRGVMNHQFKGIRVGITGGLSANTVYQLFLFLRIYPGLCWDAESGLRDQDDALDLDRCFGFMAASAVLLK